MFNKQKLSNTVKKRINKSKIYGKVGEEFVFLTLNYLATNKRDLVEFIPYLQDIKENFRKRTIQNELEKYTLSDSFMLKLNKKEVRIDLRHSLHKFYDILKDKNWQGDLNFFSDFAKEIYFKYFGYKLRNKKLTKEKEKSIISQTKIYLEKLKSKFDELVKEIPYINSKIINVKPTKLKSKQLYLIANGRRLYPDFQVSFENCENKAYAEVKANYPQSLEKIIRRDEYENEIKRIQEMEIDLITYKESRERLAEEEFGEKNDEESDLQMSREIKELKENLNKKSISETLVNQIIKKYSCEGSRWNSNELFNYQSSSIEGLIFLHQNTKDELLNRASIRNGVSSLILTIGADDFYNILIKIDNENTSKFSKHYKEFILRPKEFLKKDYFNFKKESSKILQNQLSLF